MLWFTLTLTSKWVFFIDVVVNIIAVSCGHVVSVSAKPRPRGEVTTSSYTDTVSLSCLYWECRCLTYGHAYTTPPPPSTRQLDIPTLLCATSTVMHVLVWFDLDLCIKRSSTGSLSVRLDTYLTTLARSILSLLFAIHNKSRWKLRRSIYRKIFVYGSTYFNNDVWINPTLFDYCIEGNYSTS